MIKRMNVTMPFQDRRNTVNRSSGVSLQRMDRPLVVTLPKFQFKNPDLARKISGLHADPILHERKLILDRLHGRRQLVHLRNDTRPTIGVR